MLITEPELLSGAHGERRSNDVHGLLDTWHGIPGTVGNNK